MKRILRDISSIWNIRSSAIVGLSIMLVAALIAPFLANNQPLYCVYADEAYFPVLGDYPPDVLQEFDQPEAFDWRAIEFDYAIWPPIAYNADFMDPYNRKYTSPRAKQKFKNEDLPVRWKHYLGTDRIGRDTAAGLIYGIRVSLWIGLFSAFISGIIGILTGGIAGFYAHQNARIHLASIVLFVLSIVFLIYYSFILPNFANTPPHLGLFFIGLTILFFVLYPLNNLLQRISGKRLFIPVNPDGIVMRLIEITNSVPKFLIILSIAAITQKSMMTVILIIGFTSWTEIARLFRAEVLKTRQSEYIEAAKAVGVSPTMVLLRHVTPNALGPASVAIAFAAASAILTESALSFLGVGVPEGVVTWGKMLQLGRANLQAWWLIIPPGVMILVSVFLFQNMAKRR